MINFNEQDEWLNQLTKVTGLEKFRPYLESIREVLSPLVSKWKSKKIKIVTIGGTNGKGETAMSLDYYCKMKGLKSALWTSPHILSVTERMKCHGEEIAWSELKNLSLKHWHLTSELSFYEYLFALFCFWIDKQELDVVILEVGLGGRYDAVNVFNADICALTSIDLDHQEFLGDTKELIMAEKYPISRTGSHLFTTLHDHFLKGQLKDWTARDHVHWVDLFENHLVSNDLSYSQRNRLLAATLLSQVVSPVEFNKSDIIALSQTELRLKARFELMTEGENQFIFIGAHNVEGIREMLHTFSLKGDVFNQVWMSFSKRSRSDLKDCLNLMINDQHIYKKLNLCVFNHPKACPHEDLEYLLNGINEAREIEIFNEEQWKSKIFSGNGISLVTGSYYFISSFQRFLLSRRHST